MLLLTPLPTYCIKLACLTAFDKIHDFREETPVDVSEIVKNNILCQHLSITVKLFYTLVSIS